MASSPAAGAVPSAGAVPGAAASSGLRGESGEFPTYEDYLDSQVTSRDLYYLGNEELARSLVELGYRGSGETLKREEFEARKREQEDLKHRPNKSVSHVLCGAGVDLQGYPFLQALAAREGLVRSGKLNLIIFIRDFNHKGQEVSGYVDFAQRLASEDFKPYFKREKRLLPRPSDLSYYNWETQTVTSNPTSNFQVIADHDGLLFKSKRDRKVLSVAPSGENSIRQVIASPLYVQAALYEHMTRRKS